MTHWFMDCDPLENKNGEALLLIDNALELGDVWSWKSGERFTPEEADFEVPVRIPFRRRRGYTGPLVDLVDVGVPVMSLRLHDALRDAGVDNLDSWAALLESREGPPETVPCVVYNVIGSARATGSQGLSLFRLEDNVNGIVVTNHAASIRSSSRGPTTGSSSND